MRKGRSQASPEDRRLLAAIKLELERIGSMLAGSQVEAIRAPLRERLRRALLVLTVAETDQEKAWLVVQTIRLYGEDLFWNVRNDKGLVTPAAKKRYLAKAPGFIADRIAKVDPELGTKLAAHPALIREALLACNNGPGVKAQTTRNEAMGALLGAVNLAMSRSRYARRPKTWVS